MTFTAEQAAASPDSLVVEIGPYTMSHHDEVRSRLVSRLRSEGVQVRSLVMRACWASSIRTEAGALPERWRGTVRLDGVEGIAWRFSVTDATP